MNEDEKWEYLLRLEDELLVGGVILSEWCVFIVREADIAFVKNAHLSAILTAMAGIETYLRSEYGGDSRERFANLIRRAPIAPNLKNELHKLRRFRNKWVHVNNPWDDQVLLEDPKAQQHELESAAMNAVTLLHRIIFTEQWI